MKTPGNTIWDFVKELLFEHDCVIIPGFGGFVCNPEPAKIDQVSHIITPPARHVVFNQNLKNNDGLLANRIAGSLSISYNEALKIIDEAVTKTKEILFDKKMLPIEFFGSFRLNAEANYVFLPDKQNNYLFSSYGLAPIQATTVASRSIRPSKARIFKDRKELRTVKGRLRTRIFVTSVAAIFLMVVGINILVLVNGSHIELGGNSMNISSWFDSLFHSQNSYQPVKPVEPILQKPELIITPPSINIDTALKESPARKPEIKVSEEPMDVILFAQHLGVAKTSFGTSQNINNPVQGDSVASPETPVPIHVEPKPSITVKPSITLPSGDSTFYIIGGVFCIEQNAKKFFHELEVQGYQPDIIINSRLNCNRVSYSKYTTRKEAENKLRTIQASINASAWLLVRH